MNILKTIYVIFFLSLIHLPCWAGPYTEQGINGFVDPNHQAISKDDPQAALNTIFRGWATSVTDYSPSSQFIDGIWSNPTQALGPVAADQLDIVSLGDMTGFMLDIPSEQPGEITLSFGDPNLPAGDPDRIRNGNGYDFAVFENGFISNFSTSAGTISGQMFSELAYVEVSTNGQDFVEFPSVSLTPTPTGFQAFLTIDITDIFYLAGKHPNNHLVSQGTPFDLDILKDTPEVLNGDVDLDNIKYVRIVDIPGRGDFIDHATQFTDPESLPFWTEYTSNHSIYDAWVTSGSGGFDLDAVGVLEEQQYQADINFDGIVSEVDLSFFLSSWQSKFGQDHWISRSDLAKPEDHQVNMKDWSILVSQYQEVEQWHINQSP